MLVLHSQYQTSGDFTFENLQAAQNRLKNWRNIAALRHQISGQKGEVIPSLAGKNAILEAINENLDTPKALAQTDEIFLEISITLAEKLSKSNLVELLEF